MRNCSSQITSSRKINDNLKPLSKKESKPKIKLSISKHGDVRGTLPMKVFDFKKRETPRVLCSTPRLFHMIYIKNFFMSLNSVHKNMTRENLP